MLLNTINRQWSKFAPLALAFFLLCGAITSHAQQNQADAAKEKLIQLLREEKTDSFALFRTQVLVNLRNSQDDLLTWIKMNRSLAGFAERTMKNDSTAVAIAQYALEAAWRAPNTENEFAACARLNGYIGFIFNNFKNDLHSARLYYEKAADIFINDFKKEDTTAAINIFKPLGKIMGRLRDYDRAAYYLNMARSVTFNFGKKEEEAKICNDLGVMYLNKKEFETASKILHEGLSIDGLGIYTRCLLLNNLSLAQCNLKKNNEAIHTNNLVSSLLQSPEAQEQLSSERAIALEATLYENYALIYQEIQAWDSSALYHHKNLAIHLQEASKNQINRDLAMSYQRLGCFFWESGKLDSAFWAAQQSFNWLLPNYHFDENKPIPLKADLYPEHAIFKSIELVAKLQFAFYQRQPSAHTLLQCMEAYQRLIEADELLRQIYLFEASVNNRQTLTRQHIERALTICQLGQQAHAHSADWNQWAFYFIEKGKAWLLNQRQLENNKIKLAKIPEETRQKIEELQLILQDLYHQQNEVSQLKDKIKLEQLSQKIIQTHEQLNKIQKAIIGSSAPEENELQLSAVQKKIQTKQAIVNYFMGDSLLFALFITTEDIVFTQKNSNAEYLINQIYLLREALTSTSLRFMEEDYPQFVKASSCLSDALLKDFLGILKNRAIQHLVIVSDDDLALIPFELLPAAEVSKGSSTWANFPYLINSLALSFDYSTTISEQRLEDPAARPKAERLFVGYAPIYELADTLLLASRERSLLVREGMYNLPFAKKEVLALAELMDGDPVVDTEATELHFTQYAHQYGIIHLAMHTAINLENPLFSKLLFTSNRNTGKPSSQQDGDLNANELNNQQLNASLVVLSACNTGFAKVQRGEGVLSLARFFAGRGVPSVVMSLWPAADEPTSQIMVYFYQNIKNGIALDEALRQAKLSYLASCNDKGHPFFWAPFVVIGQTNPVLGN